MVAVTNVITASMTRHADLERRLQDKERAVTVAKETAEIREAELVQESRQHLTVTEELQSQLRKADWEREDTAKHWQATVDG